MSLSLLQQTFAAKVPMVSPFLMLGDPDPATSVALAVASIDAGARVLELGLPYSDPCADGPTIQRACVRARAAGVSTTQALEVLAEIHRARPAVPLNLLVYGNLVHAWGAERFVATAAAAGASTLLVPDIPLEDSVALRAACAEHDVGWVPLVAPVTPDDRLSVLTQAASGFVYIAAMQGVTGGDLAERAEQAGGAGTLMERVRAQHASLPLCLGFGLSTRAHIDAAFAAGVTLAVVGSHLVRTIEHGIDAGLPPAEIVPTFIEALQPLLRREN